LVKIIDLKYMIKKFLRKRPLYQKLSALKAMAKMYIPLKSDLGACADNVILEYPLKIEHPQNVFIEENVKIRSGCHIINSTTEKVIIKRYSAIAVGCTMITNTHKSVVTIPHILLGASHISDKSTDIIIEEDVWIGANVTLLAGACLRRGCIVGAGSIVSKEIPPYAVAVGAPANIIAKKFELEDVLRHEVALYPEGQRLSKEYLEGVFSQHFNGLRTFGLTKEITKDNWDKINNYKQYINFVEPIHIKENK
jgi:acetyltransferase-like isoleucine patch superfamily enzyme